MQHFAVTLKRSPAGRQETQRRTVTGLGLRRLNQTVYLKDTPAIRGMLYKVNHLLSVEPIDGPPPPSSREKARQAAKA